MNDLYKDAGFILLCLLVIMVWGWLASGCSSSKETEAQARVDICPLELCCDGHAYDPRPR